MPIRILLKTTIPRTEDDWHAGRFSLLAAHLASQADERGSALYALTARDRVATASGDDADLIAAAAGEFDQLWLMAVDAGGGLSAGDVENIAKFRARGGGVFITRDHQDLGACLSKLGALGATQHFQSINPEGDPSRHRCDDIHTPSITWPNYHSGANGDLQSIEVVSPLHPIMRRPSGDAISRIPAHPHEGAVGVPESVRDVARLVARGRSRISGATFGLCVAVEEPGFGRGVADSSFHHLADYNWDPRMGCPSFVNEPAGDEVLRDAQALVDVRIYVNNVATWLACRT